MRLTRTGRFRALAPSWTATAAVLTWLIVLPLGIVGVRAANLNPLTTQGVAAPIAYALLGGLVLVGLSLVIHAEWLTGVAAGLFAAWCGTTVAANLVGTPFGYGSMSGDAGRMSALVTHFASTWVPSDAADPDLPPEYPPLYPMVIGRVAALTGRQAWGLLGTTQAMVIAASVLVAFLLWRRLVPAPLALALSGTVLVGVNEPSKANEVFALSVFLPLLLATFSPPKESGGAADQSTALHPVVAGILFGLMVPLYPNFLMFGLLGIALILVTGWLAADPRRGYAVHAGITVGVAVVVSSWYLGPLVLAYSHGRTQVVADQFKSGALARSQFELFGSSSAVLFVLQMVGVVGIVALWRRSWWARPVGLLLAGVLVVKAVMLLRFVLTGHSFLLLYVPYLFRFAVAAAGVLTLWELWQAWGSRLVERLGTPPRLSGVIAIAILIGVIAETSWSMWLPAPAGSRDANGASKSTEVSMSSYAHMEYLPDGSRPAYPAITMAPGLPATRIYRLIDADLGKGVNGNGADGNGVNGEGVDPVVLTTDQRMFSFRAFRNYLPPARESSNALTRWDDRKEVVDRIARITSPAQMASALAATEFGPIDVLVLRAKSDTWMWRNVAFASSAFQGPQFTVHTGLPEGFVVVTRKP